MELQDHTGLERLQARVECEPATGFEQRLGIILKQAREGQVSFEACPTPDSANASGAVHGGWISGVLDAVSGAAVESVLRARQNYTTLSLQVTYLRAIYPGMSLVIEGATIRAGGRVITAEARILDADGPLAIATASCMRLLPRA